MAGFVVSHLPWREYGSIGKYRYRDRWPLALPVTAVHARTDTEIAEYRLVIVVQLRLRALNSGLIRTNCAGIAGDLIGMELAQRCHQGRLIGLQQALCVLVQFAEIESHLHSRQVDGGAIRIGRNAVAGLLIRLQLCECAVQIGAILQNGGAIGLDSGGKRCLCTRTLRQRRRHQRDAR
jgi:hypothetical protein